ncbi:flavin reductase family protein [Micromonospora endophytica]|uniref:flavin reductase family protein n=1 Tax=Micromonospora endophytica TaxID=515350 RepID=UPI001BB4230D|nr:flavin reductase family protein [Micromonospora endophytica]
MREALGSFATGVTVVTVARPQLHGMTANSFTSVSLDPPLVLVCVNRDAVMHGSVVAAGSFALSVLAAEQAQTARHFADRARPHGAAQFAEVRWRPGGCTGAPLIEGALAWFECELWRTYDGGDHSIFLGRLLSARSRAAEALVFFSGRFCRLARPG